MDSTPRRSRAQRLVAPAVLAAGLVAVEPTFAPSTAHALCPMVTDIDASDGGYCGYVRVRWNRELLGTGWRVYRSLDAAGNVGLTLLATVASSAYNDMTAVPGVTYYYWVQNYGGTCSTFSPRGGPDAGWSGTLTAPTNVQASNASHCGKVRVTWNAVGGAVSYDIFRSADSNLAHSVLVGDTTATTYDDGTAPEHVDSYYWVRARSAANCDGEMPVLGKVGRVGLPPLPDLTLAPSDTSGSVNTNADGRKEFRFSTTIRNAGTAPLVVYPSKFWFDDTSDIRQKTLDCLGRTTNRYLGRFPDEDDHPMIPNFVRARIRKRLANGSPGELIAQTDITGRCLGDNYSWNSALPGWPPTAQFNGCGYEAGISVGWEHLETPGYAGHAIDLACVPSGIYWFEVIVDPDDRIRELDETNNLVRGLVSINSYLSVPDPSVCTGPQVVGVLLSPDSLLAVVGVPSDSIVGRVWIPGLTETPGSDPLTVAQVGLRPYGQTGLGEVPWTWTPATWLRQSGADDVYGSSVVPPVPGDYEFAFRFSVFDGPWVYGDLDGSLNGLSFAQTGRLHAVSTTGVGDPPPGVPLSFEALTDPARGATRFRVSLPSASTLRLSIYDVRGRLVRSFERAPRDAGVHVVEWDGRDDAGRGAPRGVYVALVETSAGARLTAKFFSLAR
jgi:hypothetical protein